VVGLELLHQARFVDAGDAHDDEERVRRGAREPGQPVGRGRAGRGRHLLEDAADLALAEGRRGPPCPGGSTHQAAHGDLLGARSQEPGLEEDEDDDGDRDVERENLACWRTRGFTGALSAKG